MNGKSIEIDNTDAEGRLILSDAIYYGSTEYKPHTLIDVATLTGSMDYGLGEVYSGVFTNSDSLWNELHAAGEVEYDRFWRMPLDEEYGPQIYSSNADLCNLKASPAKAASSLRQPSAGPSSKIPRIGAKPYARPTATGKHEVAASKLPAPGTSRSAPKSLRVVTVASATSDPSAFVLRGLRRTCLKAQARA
ncbi:hypothetical protein NUW54_g14570 [Trametes sanguinea]|uniref:Uncharacterized protein n=1 Tax=Trametes sanguinea TaxID=158606 RepID=A0ACC1MCS6_9APHY|nr:hypothetical protein NUW54_g14570 [Trametes sanguinea]